MQKPRGKQGGGQPGFAEGALAGGGKVGPAPALTQTGCVGSGTSSSLSGSQLSHLSGGGRGFKTRRVLVVGGIERLVFLGQILSDKVGRELSREKEPLLPSYTPWIFLCLWATRKALGSFFLSLLNSSFSFRTSSNVIFTSESARPGFKFQPCHLLPG